MERDLYIYNLTRLINTERFCQFHDCFFVLESENSYNRINPF